MTNRRVYSVTKIPSGGQRGGNHATLGGVEVANAGLTYVSAPWVVQPTGRNATAVSLSGKRDGVGTGSTRGGERLRAHAGVGSVSRRITVRESSCADIHPAANHLLNKVKVEEAP